MDIKVPQLAEGISSGTVVSVLVSEGDTVTKDQTLLELETEKAVAPIPATGDGKIEKIHVGEGDNVSIGQVIVTLGGVNGKAKKEGKSEASQSQSSTSVQAPSAAPVAIPQPQPMPMVSPGAAPVAIGGYQYHSPAGAPPPASPSIRKMAKDLGIDLTLVRGSGNGGRIQLEDIRLYIQQLIQLASQPQAAYAQQMPAAPSKPAPVSIDFSKFGPVTKKSMTTLRKKISEKMVESWTTIPHVTQFADADISGLLELRKKYVEAYKKAGARLTVTTFIIKAIVESLKEFPDFNASIDEATEEVVYKDYYNIGLAVDTEQGLIVPVLKSMDKKSLKEISEDVSDLAAKTRDRKVSIDDLQGGTFTISNQGGIGGSHFTPIVNKPEVAILGVGQGSQKVLVNEKKKTEIRMVLPLTLSYDHRLIDGGKAARFITDFVSRLENFDESLLVLPGSAKKQASKKTPKTKSSRKGKK